MYIGEVVKRSGASAKAIRLYEALGLLSGIKRQGRYRVYEEHDVEFIQLIKQAQKLGVTLSELKSLLVSRNTLDWLAVMELLAHKQQAIDAQIAALLSTQKQVEDYRCEIQKCFDNG
ncbi:MerR family transcriptional regulator [Photobacterium sagamiensis]|uniref:MerR family transcriptional regulator n=1 Tax=Photobacterium sagamiensis TaxID=2910241 RepID=UPI003D13C3EB